MTNSKEVISALLQEVTEAIKEHNQPGEKEKVDIPLILRTSFGISAAETAGAAAAA